MKQAKPFFGGIPTGPDVKKLMDAYGVPAPGLVSHEALEGILTLDRDASRYRTIVHAWRSRLLRENNVASIAVPGEGIRFLTEPERVEQGRRLLGLSARQVGRVHRWSVMVDVTKLDEVTRRRHDHTLRATAAMAMTASATMKELTSALKTPVAQLPRPTQN